MPPRHPCRFPFLFPFLFFFLSSLFLSLLSFSVFPVLVPFSFVLSFRLVDFRLFLVSPSLFFSLPCFPWWQILLFCYFVSAVHPLPRAPCEPEVCVFPLRAVFFLALLMLIYLYFFLLFLPFFDVDLDIVCFHPVFFLWVLCCLLGFGFCCDSFSV